MAILDLQIRFKKWAIAVVLLTRKFPSEPEFKACRNQLVRSAPSSAANYRAASRGKSTADFIHKLKIVEEELDETIFWLEFIIELIPGLKEEINPIMKESHELLAIVVASIKTARNNKS
ncbi:MAG: four helix bundle protein [Saprospiraceae bacterium]